MTIQERYRGTMMGLAIGDALGVPAEFKPRGSFSKITEIIGGGPFNLNPGEWTDDTTMALILAQSLVDNNGFNPTDQMNKYWQWVESGYMSSNGRMFDIGNTTSEALCEFRKEGGSYPYAGSTDPKKAGNGSLMRLAPIPLFFENDKDAIKFAANMSATTHGTKTCIASCVFLTHLIHKALEGWPKENLLTIEEPNNWFSHLEPDIHRNIAYGDYKTKTEDQIKSTGYVIDTLEAALWCFHTTDTFEDGCIKAVNLGDDSDTTGAVYGQLAGTYYGIDYIPNRWIDKIVKTNLIIDLADKLYFNRKLVTHTPPLYNGIWQWQLGRYGDKIKQIKKK